MKWYIYGLITICMVYNSSFCSEAYYYNQESGWYETEADYSVVNAIKAKSNLSQADVNKFNLLLLGQFQNAAAAGAGAVAAAAGAYALGTYAPTENNKLLWALAGAASMGFGAYKVLYPRVATGILQQIKTYVEMCENLDVCNFPYLPGQLIYMGTHQKNYKNELYNPLWRTTNSAWQASNIARKKGIDNLLEQGKAAIKLISKLEVTDELMMLNDKVIQILQNIGLDSTNYKSIKQAAESESQEREYKIKKGDVVIQRELQFAKNKADISLAQQKASALWYGKISLAMTAAGNFAKNTLKTLTYIYENKEKIAGGIVAIYFAPTILRTTFELQKKMYGEK